MSWISVNEYQYPEGWADGLDSDARAKWYCQQLEQGQILFWLSDVADVADAKIQVFSDESEERAAIMEYDGGLIREEAERVARHEFEDIPF